MTSAAGGLEKGNSYTIKLAGMKNRNQLEMFIR
jgi:hypothetical protein